MDHKIWIKTYIKRVGVVNGERKRGVLVLAAASRLTKQDEGCRQAAT